MSTRPRGGAGRAATAAALLLLVPVASCTSPGPIPAGPPSVLPAPGGSPGPAPAGAGTPGPTGGTPTGAAAPEPTTTNTLPPPPDPSGPAPSTAAELDAAVLPVPAGWRTVAREGGEEEAFQGNGTWVHARDPRYAAQDAITIGCADITRDDYPDPRAALEGNYEDPRQAPGVGLVLQFPDEAAATAYWQRYTDQVRACSTLDDPVRTELVPVAAPAGMEALVDRRSYPDGQWTEVAGRRGSRVTLVILSDQGHRLSTARAAALLGAMS